MRFRLAVVTALLALAGCRSAPPEDANTLVLRTYEVPKGTARPLLSTIRDALSLEEKRIVGRATLTPDGRIAVLAPANVQVGIETLVEGVNKHPPATEQTIELHYFIVLGKPAPSPAPYPAGVGEIKPALDEIVKSQGPQRFTIEKRIGLAAVAEDEGRLDGDELGIHQRCSQSGDGVYALLSLRYGKTDKIETRVHLAPDGIVVLGATGQHGSDPADDSTLYYVVRVAPHADGHAR